MKQILPTFLVIAAVDERFQERPRESGDVKCRHKTCASNLPERCLRKLFAPKHLPPSDGPSVDGEEPGQLADPPWRGPLAHGGDQDDHGPEINLWPEETNRGGCHPLPATVAIAAEAETVAVFPW